MATNGKNGNGHLPIHELATIFPPMTDDEFAGLKDDIVAHGVHQPIAVWQGEVIDGRNRYLAAQEVGIDPPFRYLDDDIDPVDFVLSANMNRRNLDSSQRSIVMAALPHLTLGANQHTEGSKYLAPSRGSRAKRASVSDELQRQAGLLPKDEPGAHCGVEADIWKKLGWPQTEATICSDCYQAVLKKAQKERRDQEH